MADLTICCPLCNEELLIDDEYLGMELECPTCKQTFTAAGNANAVNTVIPAAVGNANAVNTVIPAAVAGSINNYNVQREMSISNKSTWLLYWYQLLKTIFSWGV